MNAELLRNIPTIQEFFKINPGEELKEGIRIFLEAMEEVHIEKGKDVHNFKWSVRRSGWRCVSNEGQNTF